MKTKCGLCKNTTIVPADIRMSIKWMDLDINTDIIVFCKDCQNYIIQELLKEVFEEYGEEDEKQ